MAASYRIRPKFEAKDAVVKIATFTNPATHVPDSAVAIVIGANLPSHSHLQKMKRIVQCIDSVRENDSIVIPGSQYLKVVVPYVGDKGAVAVSTVAGTDTATDGNITIYVGSAALLGVSQYVDVALSYLLEYIIEEAKAA